jgi:DNA-binding GntR family transcriptional regulator
MARIIENVSLRDQIYEIIREMILRREIEPGQKIVEEELAGKIGVSRTPLREALCRLENEGIINFIPRRGAFVRELTRETLIEVLELREVLEGLVTRLAVEYMDGDTLAELQKCLDDIHNTPDHGAHLIKYTHADETFHKLLLSVCPNRMLKSSMSTINMHLQFIRIRTVVIPDRAKKTVEEHYQILAAIQQKDADLAETLMRKHIASVRSYAIENADLIR